MQVLSIPDWLKFRKVKQYHTAASSQKIFLEDSKLWLSQNAIALIQ